MAAEYRMAGRKGLHDKPAARHHQQAGAEAIQCCGLHGRRVAHRCFPSARADVVRPMRGVGSQSALRACLRGPLRRLGIGLVPAARRRLIWLNARWNAVRGAVDVDQRPPSPDPDH